MDWKFVIVIVTVNLWAALAYAELRAIHHQISLWLLKHD